MRRLMTSLSAALTLVALALALFQPYTARTARADDIHERCLDCTARNAERYEKCVALHGLEETRCGDQYNQGVVNCYREFCEQ